MRLVDNAITEGDEVLSNERRLSLAEMVEHAPEGPYVHLVIVRLVLDLLRRQVERGSDPRLREEV